MTLAIDDVSALLHEAAEIFVLPRFNRLSRHEIERKPGVGDPDDLVTVVDREVETFLANELPKIAAASVLGEEAAHHHPELLRLIESDEPIWIVDPIDGTKNFAAGDDGFGTMVAYANGGMVRAAWILLPARGQLFVAEAGSGAFMNGASIRTRQLSPNDIPRGAAMTRFMPNGLGDRVVRAIAPHHRPVPPTGCAAIEYTEILRGEREFVLYHRLLPWDHGAPALVLTEAGGCVRHASGADYALRSSNQPTVAASEPRLADRVIGWLPR